MLIMTSKGLYCPAGNFYIDPTGAVSHALITHAHSDHARRGSKVYYCTTTGAALLKARLGQTISVHSLPYGATYDFGPVRVSFHPAGHILGSSQIRLEYLGEVWVVSGDYKREPDQTCAAFESLNCDVFITEATFGTPTYCWEKHTDIGQDILAWWHANAADHSNSVLFAYSLGKTQRILNLLAGITNNPVYCDISAKAINDCYHAEQINLGSPICISTLDQEAVLKDALLIAPPSFLKSKRAHLLGERFKTAFASGWMRTSRPHVDKGFILSDHANWNDLITTIQETGAKRVYVQHRGHGALVRYLRSIGIKAYPDSHLIPKNPAQLSLF